MGQKTGQSYWGKWENVYGTDITAKMEQMDTV